MPKPDDPSNGANGKPDKSVEAPGADAKAPATTTAQATGPASPTDAIALLTADHRKVEGLFAQYQKATSGKDEIVRQICTELTVHTLLEEEIFYPACRRAASDEEPLDEAQVEHDSAKVLIADLLSGSDQDRFRDAKVSVLAEQIKHHVGEEEAPTKGIFARAQAAGVNTPALAAQLQKRKQALMNRADDLQPSRPVSFEISLQTGHSKEDTMASYRGNDRDRDERGRFIDEDRDGRRGGRSRDDDRRYSARGGRDDDDGRGWYGDPQGHSEASRRGWAERGGGYESRSFRGDDDDDRRYSSRGNDRDRDDRGRFMSDDDRGYGARGGGRDRDERGRFTDNDDRGYSSGGYDRDRDDRGRFVSDDDRGYRTRSSGNERNRDDRGRFTDDDERGYGARSNDRDRDDRGRFMSDDDRDGRGRGQGGWFGDSRGHAEAARRGWDERSGGRSRSSRDDDDDRRAGGRDHGGWFGDSRGHAEAARRGWQDRR